MSAVGSGALLCQALDARALRVACADDDADGQGDGVDGRRGRIGPRPAPYGAEGLHEHAMPGSTISATHLSTS